MSPAQKNADLCFVISPIGSSDSETRKRADHVLTYVIQPAVDGLGLTIDRADRIAAPGSVFAQIVDRLTSAKIVVADLTDLNPNVFYELAIRDGYDRPVVLIAEVGTALPFDLIQQRTIFFDHRDVRSVHEAIGQLRAGVLHALNGQASTSPFRFPEQALGHEQELVRIGEALEALRVDVQRLGSDGGDSEADEQELDDLAPSPILVCVRLLSAAMHHGIVVRRPLSLVDVVIDLGAAGLRDVSDEDLVFLRDSWRQIPAGQRGDDGFRAMRLVRAELRRRRIERPS